MNTSLRMFKIIPSKGPDKCVAYRCSNASTPKDRFCSRHRHRYNKINNPIKYTYAMLKSNARRRGKYHLGFLSIEEFTKFCEEHNYMELKGKSAGSASIDRIDPTKGYTYCNIQILSLSQNSAKMHEDNNGDSGDDEVPF